LFPEIEEVRRGGPRFDLRLLRLSRLDRHQPFWSGIGQPAQHQRIHHREDGRIAADAEPERQRRNRREGQVSPEEAECVAQIVRPARGESGAPFGDVDSPAQLVPVAQLRKRAAQRFILARSAGHRVRAGLFQLQRQLGDNFVFPLRPHVQRREPFAHQPAPIRHG
jgi:hypothetical protein